jgi:hypothetical protein
MKKSILFLTIASLFLSCSNSDNGSNANNNCSTISPPSWIQGTWIRGVTPNSPYGYKFTTNDVIELSPTGTNSISRKGQIDFYCSANVPYTITENSTSTSYFLEINWSGIATYNFTKISDNKIELVNDNDSVNATYYIKQ